MKKILAMLIMGLFAFGAFAGCIGGDEKEATTPTSTNPQSWTATTKDIGNVAFIADDPLGIALFSPLVMHNGIPHPVLSPESNLLKYYANTVGTAGSPGILLSSDPADLSIELANFGWESATGAFMVSGYRAAIVVAPFASMLAAPVFYVDGETVAEETLEAMDARGITEAIVIETCPAPSKIAFERLSIDSLNARYIKAAAGLGLPIDYIIATNPKDAVPPAINETQNYEVSGTITGGTKSSSGQTVDQQVGNDPVEFAIPEGYAMIEVDLQYDTQTVYGDDNMANIDVYLYAPDGEHVRVFHDFSGNMRHDTIVVKDMPGTWIAEPRAIIAENTPYTLKVNASSLDNGWRAAIPGLSASAAVLGVYRHGVILADEEFGLDEPMSSRPQPSLTCGGRLVNDTVDDANRNVGVVRNAVNKTVDMLIKNGMGPSSAGGSLDITYLSLVGGPVSIPFNYYWFYFAAVNGELADYTPYDLAYGDLDEDEFTQELAVGRFVSRKLSDNLEMIGREMVYEQLIEEVYGSLGDVGAWKNTATVYAGNLLLEGNWAVIMMNAQMKLQNDGGFNPVYGNYGPTANEQTVKPQIESSNYVWFHVHGGPQAIAAAGAADSNGFLMQSAREVAKYDMGPGVCMASSCLTSKIDDMNPDDAFSLAWLHAGYLGYFGATRPSLGAVTPCVGPLDMGGSNGMCYLFLNELIDNDATLGQALMNTKNKYADMYGWTGTDEYAMREFVVYGDPAFNPYEPCNEGSR